MYALCIYTISMHTLCDESRSQPLRGGAGKKQSGRLINQLVMITIIVMVIHDLVLVVVITTTVFCCGTGWLG